MTISNLQSSNGYYQTGQTNSYGSVRQSFQQLGTAISSGNLSDAQTALTAILQNLPNGQGNSKNQIGSDLQSLQSAIKSGDVSSTQKAYSTLQNDMQTAKTSRGHHHHHKDGDSQSTSTSSSSTQNDLSSIISNLSGVQTASSSGGTVSTQDGLQNNTNQPNQELQALLDALKSGDANSVQNAYSTLMQNIQNSFNGNIVGNIIDTTS